MALAVESAIATSTPAIIEAGTGTGKSLGYLIPAALSRRTVVIATATKALQDQLITKEVPAIKAAGVPLSAAVLKGRLNYLCLKKFNEFTGPTNPTTLSSDHVQFDRITDWASTTTSGERDELAFDVSPPLWSSLSMSADECPGASNCPYGAPCYAERAKAAAAASDIIIVNAALYGAHISTGRTLLPPHEAAIFDEAHQLPDILSRALGAEINAPRIRALTRLARPLVSVATTPLLTEMNAAADSLQKALEERIGLLPEISRVGSDPSIDDSLVALETAAEELLKILDGLKGLSQGDELSRLSLRGVVVHLRTDLVNFLIPDDNDLIFIEGDLFPTLVCAPIDLGHLLKPLWEDVTPIMTSATIPSFFSERLGLTGAIELELPSPFDYKKNSLLYVPSHLSDRRTDQSEVEIAAELTELITAAGGRTLALFTSRRALEKIGLMVRQKLTTPVLLQGDMSRASLLEAFITDEATSLFATMGFWQGVDIPGRTLSLLTIDRLPFMPPDDPMQQARRERAGSGAFYTVDLPRAAMLLAQGIGRLIRNASDRGVVAVFDTRLSTASYKDTLLGRLPDMKRTTNQAVATEFLRSLHAHE
jgi:ATP-dependent DNA helicase DinG